jgi:hypothetical protein
LVHGERLQDERHGVWEEMGMAVVVAYLRHFSIMSPEEMK